VVQPWGTVVVPFSANFGSIQSFISSDGGASWSEAFPVSLVFHHATVGLRSPPLPSAELDADGNVFLAWADCRFRSGCSGNDIVIASSADGTVWSDPWRVPIDEVGSGADHFIPGLGVDRGTAVGAAHLALAYYFYPVSGCTFTTCQLFAGFISSADSGLTWTAPSLLTDTPMQLSWLPNTNQGRMVGDYLSTSHLADGTAHPVIVVARPPGADFDQAVYTPAAGLLGPSGPATRGSAGRRQLPNPPVPTTPAGEPPTAR
jgi:hypothetical protein